MPRSIYDTKNPAKAAVARARRDERAALRCMADARRSSSAEFRRVAVQFAREFWRSARFYRDTAAHIRRIAEIRRGRPGA